MNCAEHRDFGASAPPTLEATSALFLDFDGTLVALARTPEEVQIAPQLISLIADLRMLLDGALALITGRRLESVDHWLGSLHLAGSGLHGAQLRAAGVDAEPDFLLPGLIAIESALRARFGDDARVLIENKGASLALHYRLAPERAQECEAALSQLAQLHALEVVPGHAVIEARERGIDKGTGLRSLMSLPPFAGRRPVFVGDDRTDEDAIVAAQALDGDGIRVGAQDSVARYRLSGVEAVHAWLQASRDALAKAPQ